MRTVVYCIPLCLLSRFVAIVCSCLNFNYIILFILFIMYISAIFFALFYIKRTSPAVNARLGPRLVIGECRV